MTIKIQCPCGAKYSFEVEPVEGQMPFPVQCPACHADGTEIANRLIAETPAKPRLRVSTVAAEVAEAPPPPLRPLPVGSAMDRIQRERRQFRAAGWIAGLIGLVILALVGGWCWLTFVGSKPRLEYSVKVPGAEAGWRTEFLEPGIVFMVSPERAIVHDLKAGKDLWSVSLADKASDNAPPQTFIDKDGIWLCLGTRVVQLNRATGETKQTIPIAGQFESFTPSETNLLVVSAKDETTRLVSRIDPATGAVATDEITVPRAEKHAMPNELPPNVQPTAGVLLAQALDEQKFNKPLDAMSSEFFSTGANLVELRVKLLEPKVTFVQSIKPRGPTHITSNLTAGDSTADVAEEVFNDIKRDQTGGVKGLDESRYEATIRRWMGGKAPVEWKAETTGVPMFFSLKTTDLLVAGQQLTVFDKENKKLFDAKLAYRINGRFTPDRWDHHSVPAVEGPGGLYFFDEGVLTAFSLPAGEVRWRLTSVGINKVQFDDHGILYVDSTSGSPDDIQYSEQIKFDKAAPVLLKIDPSSGKILWQVANQGQGCFLSGPFLYSASAQQGGVAMANGLAEALNAPRPDAPVYFHIFRLDPASGKILWDFYRTEAPGDLSFQQNRFLLRFGADVQVWKFIVY